MRRFGVLLIVIPIVLIFLLSVANSAKQDQWFEQIREYYKGAFNKGGSAYTDWDRGIKQEFGLNLQKIVFDIELIETREDENLVAITFTLTIRAQCYDSEMVKKTIKDKRDIIALVEKKSKKIVAAELLDQTGISLVVGWNGTEI